MKAEAHRKRSGASPTPPSPERQEALWSAHGQTQEEWRVQRLNCAAEQSANDSAKTAFRASGFRPHQPW